MNASTNHNNKINTVVAGIIIGILVPFMAYGILLSLYDQLDNAGIFNPVGLSPGFRERTIALFALICNVIPLHYLNKRYMLDAMRGIVFPTFVYVILWMYYYGMDLIQ